MCVPAGKAATTTTEDIGMPVPLQEATVNASMTKNGAPIGMTTPTLVTTNGFMMVVASSGGSGSAFITTTVVLEVVLAL